MSARISTGKMMQECGAKVAKGEDGVGLQGVEPLL